MRLGRPDSTCGDKGTGRNSLLSRASFVICSKAFGVMETEPAGKGDDEAIGSACHSLCGVQRVLTHDE